MVEGGIPISLDHPVQSRFQHPKITLLVQDALKFLLEQIFQVD